MRKYKNISLEEAEYKLYLDAIDLALQLTCGNTPIIIHTAARAITEIGAFRNKYSFKPHPCWEWINEIASYILSRQVQFRYSNERWMEPKLNQVIQMLRLGWQAEELFNIQDHISGRTLRFGFYYLADSWLEYASLIRQDLVNIYCDISCSKEYEICAGAFVVEYRGNRQVHLEEYHNMQNTRGEVAVYLRAIQYALQYWNGKPILIYSDYYEIQRLQENNYASIEKRPDEDILR